MHTCVVWIDALECRCSGRFHQLELDIQAGVSHLIWVQETEPEPSERMPPLCF